MYSLFTSEGGSINDKNGVVSYKFTIFSTLDNSIRNSI
jgi:hypothetical protein